MRVTEHLSVKDFGPIVNLTIDFNRITLLLGASACGKSTLLKLVAMMRHILKVQLVRSVLRSFKVKGSNLPRIRSDSYVRNAGFETYFKPTTAITYTLDADGHEVRIELDSSRHIQIDGEIPDGLIYKIAFLTDMRSALAMWTDGGARSAAKGLKALDYYFGETYDMWITALEHLKAGTLALPHFAGMSVTTRMTAFHQRLVNIHADQSVTDEFSLALAASGLKTSVPLVVMLDYLSHGDLAVREDFRKSILDQVFDLGIDGVKIEDAVERIRSYEQGKAFVGVQIEEPELSLDPETQVNLLRTMARLALDCDDDRIVSLAFATHSPYVLTALNDLVLVERHPSLKEGIVAPHHAISGTVSAWQIKDGHAVNLVDAETGYVSADEMDAVSRKGLSIAV